MNTNPKHCKLANEVIENFNAVNEAIKWKQFNNEEVRSIWSEILAISHTLNNMDYINNPPAQKQFPTKHKVD